MPTVPGPALSFSDSFTKVWNFLLTGGWFMLPLLLCSLILLAVIVWKTLDLRTPRIISPDLTARLLEARALIAAGKFSHLQQALLQDHSVLGIISRAAILSQHPDQAAAARAAETCGREQIAELERGISIMEVIFTIAPMLGLIGTVSGLVRIFGNFGEGGKDAAAAQEIAAGIAEAMNTTIAGLAVAVPALIAQVYFSRKIERAALRMSTLINNTLDALWQSAP